MQLSQILAQDRAVAVLRNALRRDRVAHAYLFVGPEGVGKRTTALAFAKALNCANPQARAQQDNCGRCEQCPLIESGNHPDVRLIGAVREEGVLHIIIDQIRRPLKPDKRKEHPPPYLRTDAYLRPSRGERKVYLLDPADLMTAPAANALLQVLEEPPEHVVIVLITEEPSGLLPTVVSRCQQVRFNLASPSAIEAALTQRSLDSERARVLAALSGGRIGHALRMAQTPDTEEVRTRVLELMAAIPGAPAAAALKLAYLFKLAAVTAAPDLDAEEEEPEDEAEASRKRVQVSTKVLRAQLPKALDIALSWYRDLLIAREGDLDLVVNLDRVEELKRQSQDMHPGLLHAALAALMAGKQQIERNANLDLALQRMMVQLVRQST